MRAHPLTALVLILFLAAGSVFLAAQQKVNISGLLIDLENPDPNRRKQAAQLLGQVKSEEAVPALIKTTEDEDDAVRFEAVRALVRINDSRALPSYIRLTQDSRRDTQEKSIEGIINVYVAEQGGFIQGVKKFADTVNPFSDDYNPLTVESYVSVHPEALQALSNLLPHSDARIRKDAATALGILRAHSALPDIEKQLRRERNDDVKVELIRAFYKIADPVAARGLVSYIRDSSKKVHDEAIFTVGRLRVIEAVPDLKDIYESDVRERRRVLGVLPVSRSDDLLRKVLEALAYIGDPSCREIFLSALEDERDFYRRFAAEGLGRMGDRSVVTQLATKHLREQIFSVKMGMSYALYRLGRDEHLVELIQNDQGAFYLLELNPEEVSKLLPYLESEKDSVRVRVLEVIGLRGDPNALPVVQKMTQHSNIDVVSAANLAIRRIRGRYPTS
jgi:HEAT repeat protein